MGGEGRGGYLSLECRDLRGVGLLRSTDFFNGAGALIIDLLKLECIRSQYVCVRMINATTSAQHVGRGQGRTRFDEINDRALSMTNQCFHNGGRS